MDAHHLVTTTPNLRIPEFRPGDTVKVGVRIREGTRERVQTFQGVVIRKTGGKSPAAAFTVRSIFRGDIGVERIFPLYSPRIESVEVVRGGKVRRARLYYLRGRFGRAARIKERPIRLRTTSIAEDAVEEADTMVVTDVQDTEISDTLLSTSEDVELDASQSSDPDPTETETESPVTADGVPEATIDEPTEVETESPATADAPPETTIAESTEAASEEPDLTPADTLSTQVNEGASDDPKNSSEQDEEETRASS